MPYGSTEKRLGRRVFRHDAVATKIQDIGSARASLTAQLNVLMGQ
jgi:hypothetical protein